MVCISADTLPICSGVLIGPHTVLTAGHCINTLGTGVTYFVNFGPDCTKPRTRKRVEEQLTHPSYTAEGAPFDLGIIKLATESDVVPMPLSDTQPTVGSTVRHVGYGTNQEQPMSGRGVQRTVSHALLRIDDDFLWSGDAMANTCLGDSGGPVLVNEQVVAVVSDGPDCHSESADQRIDRGREWIDATRGSFEPKPADPPKTGCSTAPMSMLWLALAALARRAAQKQSPRR